MTKNTNQAIGKDENTKKPHWWPHFLHTVLFQSNIFGIISFRMVKIKKGQILSIVLDSAPVSSLVRSPDVQYWIDCIPDEELGPFEHREILIPCMHFTKVCGSNPTLKQGFGSPKISLFMPVSCTWCVSK